MWAGFLLGPIPGPSVVARPPPTPDLEGGEGGAELSVLWTRLAPGALPPGDPQAGPCWQLALALPACGSSSRLARGG